MTAMSGDVGLVDDAALFPLLARLESWGDANPDRYAGSWLVEAPDVAPRVGVGLVGPRVPRELRDLLRGEPADVVTVQHSLRDLEALAETIETRRLHDASALITAVGVIQPDNVVDVRSGARDLEQLEKELRASYGTGAIRVGREHRSQLLDAARRRR